MLCFDAVFRRFPPLLITILKQAATTFKVEKWSMGVTKSLGLELAERVGAPLQKTLVRQQHTKQVCVIFYSLCVWWCVVGKLFVQSWVLIL